MMHQLQDITDAKKKNADSLAAKSSVENTQITT